MTMDLGELQDLVDALDGEVRLHAGHLSDPSSTCECPYIMDEAYAGGIATIHVSNGIPSIADGGNDCPPREIAIAYMRLLVGAANALPGLLREIRELRGT